MPFRFSCPKCSNKVVFRHLKVGEKVHCYFCDAEVIVPPDIEEVGEEVLYLARLKSILGARPDKSKFQNPAAKNIAYGSARNGFLEILKFLLEKGFEINKPEWENGPTLLHNAVNENQASAVKLLLENGADISLKDKYGCTPFDMLVGVKIAKCWNSKSDEIFKLLRTYKAKINNVVTAACFGTIKDIKKLVAKGADVDCCLGIMKITALHVAVSENKLELLEYLISLTNNINARDSNSLTALDVSASQEAERILRNHGGKKSEEIEYEERRVKEEANNIGKGMYYGNELFQAAKKGNFKRCEEIINFYHKDDDLSVLHFLSKDDSGNSAIDVAVEGGHKEIVKILLDNGWEPSKQLKQTATL